MYRKYFKRPFDIVVSLIAIIILSPLYIVLCILVLMKLGRPVIFRQKRPGLNGEVFMMFKFRSMINKFNEKGEPFPDKDRLTNFGKFLRSTSLDELPELFNILIGNMSLVGPRPQLIRDMVFMNDVQRERFSVKQGLTGLAQINGRNIISWEQKIDYDLEYVKNITFIGDLKIIFGTIFSVIMRSDITSVGMETAEDYGDCLLRINQISKEQYDSLLIEASKIEKLN